MYEKVKNLARDRNVSIPKIEKELGLGNGTISKWGTSSPKVENLKKVADYFGISIEYFLDDAEKVES